MDTYRELYVFQELYLEQLILRTPQGDDFVRNSLLLSLQKGLQVWKQAVIVICPRLNSTLIGTTGKELLRFWTSVLHSHHQKWQNQSDMAKKHTHFCCMSVWAFCCLTEWISFMERYLEKYWCN